MWHQWQEPETLWTRQCCKKKKRKKEKAKASRPWSKFCALKPDILLYPPGARYIKEPPPNLHRIHTSEESRGAHEIFSLFSCIQIDTYIKQLKHTSVIFYGAGSCLAEDEGITGTGSGELQKRHGVVPNIVIKSSSARMLSKLKCSFSPLFFTLSILRPTTAKHILITLVKSTCTSLSQVHDKPINFLKCPESAKHFNLLYNQGSFIPLMAKFKRGTLVS